MSCQWMVSAWQRNLFWSTYTPPPRISDGGRKKGERTSHNAAAQHGTATAHWAELCLGPEAVGKQQADRKQSGKHADRQEADCRMKMVRKMASRKASGPGPGTEEEPVYDDIELADLTNRSAPAAQREPIEGQDEHRHYANIHHISHAENQEAPHSSDEMDGAV
ncbi:hypothetical protein CRUP_008918 [Coryphaenoides rupestris]|nr:hypothetical protein CRUP_008918 [Coryphaenoides rupestris]